MRNKKGVVLSVLFVFFIFGVTIPLFMTNHRKIKADPITDLTGTTWIINDSPSTLPNGNPFGSYYNDYIYSYNINFTSNNINFKTLSFQTVEDVRTSMIYSNNDEDITVLNYQYSYSWASNNYKTIEITGGSGVTNADLIYWFTNNATQYTPTPPGTEITHKYWSIATGFRMQLDELYSDEEIEYTVLFNEQRRQFDETSQTGLVFKGPTTEDNTCYMWAINGSGINLLYRSEDDRFLTSCWFEFTPGDYLNTDLYDFMSLIGHWFDDDQAYLCGTSQGYAEGFINGRANGQADGTQYTGLITGIFNGLGSLLSIQVFPNITIGLLIGLPLLLGVLIIIIKILRG